MQSLRAGSKRLIRAAAASGFVLSGAACAQFSSAPCADCVEGYNDALGADCSFDQVFCFVWSNQTLIFVDASNPWTWHPNPTGHWQGNHPPPRTCGACCPESFTTPPGQLEPAPGQPPTCPCNQLPQVVCSPSPATQTETTCVTLELGGNLEIEGSIVIAGISFTKSDSKCREVVETNPCSPFTVPRCYIGKHLTRSKVQTQTWRVNVFWEAQVKVSRLTDFCTYSDYHTIAQCASATYTYTQQSLAWESVICGDLEWCGPAGGGQ